MTTKPYSIALEIAGPTAMWTRPDTGDAPVSYPAPTFSAAKAVFESLIKDFKLVFTSQDPTHLVLKVEGKAAFGAKLSDTEQPVVLVKAP